MFGGGMAYGTLNNSLVVSNRAEMGGGALYSTLNNCTVVNNIATVNSGGTYSASARNCIVVNNYEVSFYIWTPNNYDTCVQFYYSCTSPGASINGNINSDPVFLDLFHISSFSPCRGVGSVTYASGFDLDGEAWNNPPSMGCDELVQTNLVGPLSVNLTSYQTNLIVGRPILFSGSVTGRVAYISWSFGDGMAITNGEPICAHLWANLGTYTVTLTAYNNDNPAGVATNIVVYVEPLMSPQIQSPVWLTNGFQFQFPGQGQANYTIQYATNLVPPVTWQTLQLHNYNNQNVVQIMDTSATGPARFYRISAQ